jgi:hypothetical protein
MKRIIVANDKLYTINRSFKGDGWFGRVVENMNVDEILFHYHSDKLLKDTNGIYHLVNEIGDVEIIEEIIEEIIC